MSYTAESNSLGYQPSQPREEIKRPAIVRLARQLFRFATVAGLFFAVPLLICELITSADFPSPDCAINLSPLSARAVFPRSNARLYVEAPGGHFEVSVANHGVRFDLFQNDPTQSDSIAQKLWDNDKEIWNWSADYGRIGALCHEFRHHYVDTTGQPVDTRNLEWNSWIPSTWLLAGLLFLPSIRIIHWTRNRYKLSDEGRVFKLNS